MSRDMIHPPEMPTEEMEVLPMLHATSRAGDIWGVGGGAMLPMETLATCCPDRGGDGSGTAVGGGNWNEIATLSHENASLTPGPFSSFPTKTLVSTPPQLDTNALPPGDPMMPWVSSFPRAFGMKDLQTQRAETVIDEYTSTVAHTGLPVRLPPLLTFEPYHAISSFFPGVLDINYGLSSSTSAKGSPYPSTCMLPTTQKPEMVLYGMMKNNIATRQEYANHNSNNVQQAADDTTWLVNAAPPTPDLTALDDSAFIRRISRGEKREKIDRYLKKKKQRNYRKRIKYACRKTLADGRRRMKGRFARKDDGGGGAPGVGSNN